MKRDCVCLHTHNQNFNKPKPRKESTQKRRRVVKRARLACSIFIVNVFFLLIFFLYFHSRHFLSKKHKQCCTAFDTVSSKNERGILLNRRNLCTHITCAFFHRNPRISRVTIVLNLPSNMIRYFVVRRNCIWRKKKTRAKELNLLSFFSLSLCVCNFSRSKKSIRTVLWKFSFATRMNMRVALLTFESVFFCWGQFSIYRNIDAFKRSLVCVISTKIQQCS